MERKIYHVTRNGHGWKSILENSGRASVTGDHKSEVVDRTIALAKGHAKSSVIIYKVDGTVHEEKHFPKVA
ncbi:hypothetical protein HYN59_09375 [Flavobacterium album]|uniref:DUF2188 domain-containing protein n=1 Tax=Flavobacterium album TaxID=2175091 RepID=A0A2S1QY50_9FLAO|nr:DUF2188 domain-containing protein [Flavobacterium album]AWH85315.1 hypothetical protein HYN59_09375 [Flavobacterium album]